MPTWLESLVGWTHRLVGWLLAGWVKDKVSWIHGLAEENFPACVFDEIWVRGGGTMGERLPGLEDWGSQKHVFYKAWRPPRPGNHVNYVFWRLLA